MEFPTSAWKKNYLKVIFYQLGVKLQNNLLIFEPRFDSVFVFIFLGCKVYVLESVSVLRKYAGHLDLPISFFLSSVKYIVPMDKRFQIRKAMEAHKTQYVWFRKLYMIFSRYIFVNTLKEVDVLDLELEFELGEDDTG